MQTLKIDFKSGPDRLVGLLHLPAGKARGAVVLSGPLTSVKEQAPRAYAEALAQRGFAAIAFDHAGFGESGGEPRQFENPQGKANDIRAAAAALAERADLAPLAVAGVGVCAGGGYMATAVATDGRFSAFCGVAGVYTAAAETRRWMGDRLDIELERARRAERRWREDGFVEVIPAVAEEGGDVAMPMREAYEYYGTSRGGTPGYVNAFAVQSRAYTLVFDALHEAARLTLPSLIVHSEHALAPGLARRFYSDLPGQKEQVWLQSQGQIDFYDDPEVIGPAADAVADFLNRVLPA